MDDLNTDSDSHSVTSTQSVSSTSSKQKLTTATSHVKESSAPAKPISAQSKRKQDDEGKTASTPKRKKTDGTDPSGAGGATPSSSSARKAAPLSERQQMALALAMSAQESGGGTSPSQTSQRPSTTDTTPRSAMLRKVNRKNEKGESPLHLATIKGDVAGMKRLLKAGADVNVSDYAGWTALHEACNHGFVDAAKLLLKKGANVNAQGLDNDTPLHDAAINGHPELVALLLKYGANAFQGNSKGQSPLNVALNDNISKLLKGETVFKLPDDESDMSASSPECTIPREEEIASATTGLDLTSAAKPVLSGRPAGDVISSLPADESSKADDDDDDLLDRTLTAETYAAGDNNMHEVTAATALRESEDTAAVSPTASTPTASSRPTSTGFVQEGAHTEKTVDLPAEPDLKKPDVSTQSVPESTKQIMIMEEVAALELEDTIQTTNTPSPEMTSGSPAVPELFSKSVRQSLDFKPIKVEVMSSMEAVDSSATHAAAAELVKQEGCTISDFKPADLKVKSESDPTFGGSLPKVENIKTEKTVPMDTEETAEVKSVNLPREGEAAQSPNNDIPTPVQDCATPEPPMEASPDSAIADKAVKPFTSKSLPFTERKSVEQVKNETKSLSRPVSPALEKSQRMRTGSMNRKRRQAPTPLSSTSTIDVPVQPEGDNSKDSTDSFMSNSSATRASRSRNKQQTNQQPPEEDPLPVRETRRKTMMKAAANSPFVERLPKSGAQKVPPLTIKLSGKAPVSSTSISISSVTQATMTAGNEPYVMLQDKETERANSALAKEQAKDADSPEAQESKDRKESTVTNVQAQTTESTSAQQSAATSSMSTSTGVSTRRTLRSHTNRNQGTVGEKLEDPVPPRKSKRMKTEPAVPSSNQPTSLPPPPGPLTIFNPYSLFKGVREQMLKKWERIVTVHPRVPTGYSTYLINTKKYLLQKNASTNASKLAIPLLVAPSQLTSEMKELFNKQEHERYKLRQQHLIEGEKLRIAYEQEILRVYTRGARAAANQETPLSVCTIMKDKESGTVYHPFNALKDGSAGPNTADDKQQGERTSARSHFNNRQLISWLQDSEDKFDKLKDQMLSRHHHEAESLYAVQTMNWEWKLKELGLCDYKSQPTIDMLHVPMVLVNDEADILNSS